MRASAAPGMLYWESFLCQLMICPQKGFKKVLARKRKGAGRSHIKDMSTHQQLGETHIPQLV